VFVKLDYYVSQFKAAGMDGALNWYRVPNISWALTPQLAGAKVRADMSSAACSEEHKVLRVDSWPSL